MLTHLVNYAIISVAQKTKLRRQASYITLVVLRLYKKSQRLSNKNGQKGGEILYEKFAKLLDETNKTAYQVSKDTGVSTATLSSWKKGEYTPKVDKLKILADYFGVSIEYFLEQSQNNKTTPPTRKEEKHGRHEKDTFYM